LKRLAFGFEHRPEILAAGCDHEHEQDRQQRIETVWNGGKKQQVSFRIQVRQVGDGFSDQTDFVADPGSDQRDTGNRRGS
jgi:hypothetical protein